MWQKLLELARAHPWITCYALGTAIETIRQAMPYQRVVFMAIDAWGYFSAFWKPQNYGFTKAQLELGRRFRDGEITMRTAEREMRKIA